jgi:methyl-accepting chemotaxis protein
MSLFVWVVLGFAVALCAIQHLVLQVAKRAAAEACAAWVEECIGGLRSEQTRDSAIRDLERRLDSGQWHGLLRRVGIAAPLVGVVLSAAAVMLEGGAIVDALRATPSPSDSGSGGVDLGTRIIALSAGVCAGAAIALFNHLLMWLLQGAESEALDRALNETREARFRDSEDRLDHIVGQLREGGEILARTTDLLGGMLELARRAMQGMSESCNEAATDLKSISLNLREGLQAPIAEFIAASTEVRDATRAAGDRISEGIDALNGRLSEAAYAMQTSVRSAGDRLTAGLESAGSRLASVSQSTERMVAHQAEGISRLESSASAIERASESISKATETFDAAALERLSRASRTAAGALEAAWNGSDRIPERVDALNTSLQSVGARLAELEAIIRSGVATNKQALDACGAFAAEAHRARDSVRDMNLPALAQDLARLRESGSAKSWLWNRAKTGNA